MVFRNRLRKFIKDEKSGGLVLIICTIVSLIMANSPFNEQYSSLWHIYIGGLSLEHWINDGLMAVFFLMIGLELEREIYIGEFSKPKNAILPIAAAIGGMLVPATFYFFFNRGLDTQSGIGIPMATDIAFALGILSLLGKRVPFSLKLFLMALAVVDDLGAIIIIAVFYTKDLDVYNLFIALGIFVGLIVLNRLKIYSLLAYLIGGVVMWYFMLQSGVHATITGVLLAFVIPFAGRKDGKSPSFYLLHKLHLPVAFVILPLFALANTAVTVSSDIGQIITQPVSLGVITGLFLGKPLGIFLACWLVLITKLSKLPTDITRNNIFGVGFLGGIGFTMSIFITLLAFENAEVINAAKIAILLSSLLAGVAGYFYLKVTLKETNTIS
ncbi:MAG: Na+/H+ antiporter NhaA [Dysgonomonas sp.]|nr:Na+/H+ antiporter NhaA [Dysgonomonas sp.]